MEQIGILGLSDYTMFAVLRQSVPSGRFRSAVTSKAVCVKEHKVFFLIVGLSMMCYTKEKARRTCLGERQLRGLIGKLLY